MQSLAEREPGIAFTHIYPGIVRTPLFHFGGNSLLMKPIHAVLGTLLVPFSVTPAVCAEHMLWALLDGQKGAYRRDCLGDDIGQKGYYGNEEARARVWEHTEQEINRALETKA